MEDNDVIQKKSQRFCLRLPTVRKEQEAPTGSTLDSIADVSQRHPGAESSPKIVTDGAGDEIINEKVVAVPKKNGKPQDQNSLTQDLDVWVTRDVLEVTDNISKFFEFNLICCQQIFFFLYAATLCRGKSPRLPAVHCFENLGNCY